MTTQALQAYLSFSTKAQLKPVKAVFVAIALGRALAVNREIAEHIARLSSTVPYWAEYKGMDVNKIHAILNEKTLQDPWFKND